MKGELANINGRFEYLPNYPVIETIINGPLSDKEEPSYFSVEPVLQNYLNEDTTELSYNRFKYDEKKKVELWLLWKLRYYKNSVTNFFKQLNNLTILHKDSRDSAKNIILPLISLCFIEQQELRTLTGFVKEDIKITSDISPSGFTIELMEGMRNNKLEFSNYENYRKYLEVMGIMKEIVNGISLIKVEGGFQGEWLRERLGKLYIEMDYLLQKYSEFN